MHTRLSKFIALLAAVQLLGGHWAVLQSVAWVGMLASNLTEEPVTAAVSKTFDGDHPCSLCHVVKTGQQEEKQQETVKQVVKIDAVLPVKAELPLRAVAPGVFFSTTLAECEVVYSPQTLPPRLV